MGTMNGMSSGVHARKDALHHWALWTLPLFEEDNHQCNGGIEGLGAHGAETQTPQHPCGDTVLVVFQEAHPRKASG